MNIRLVCLLLLLAGLGLGTSGCLAVAVGAGAAGTVAYVRGDLEAEEPYGIEQTYTATRAAAKELGLTIIEGETDQDALGARVTARDYSDKRIQVRLKALTSNATKLSIRIGTFGDKTKTQRVYNTIHDHLKASARVPAEPSQPASPPAEPPQATATSTETPQTPSAEAPQEAVPATEPPQSSTSPAESSPPVSDAPQPPVE